MEFYSFCGKGCVYQLLYLIVTDNIYTQINRQTHSCIFLFSECWPQVQVPLQEGNVALHWAQRGGDRWQQHCYWYTFQEVWEGKQ